MLILREIFMQLISFWRNSKFIFSCEFINVCSMNYNKKIS